jgi:hypothetical protein
MTALAAAAAEYPRFVFMFSLNPSSLFFSRFLFFFFLIKIFFFKKD